MTVLVAYASKYGSTRAERIAETLASWGVDAVAQSVSNSTDLSRYDAFVLSSRGKQIGIVLSAVPA